MMLSRRDTLLIGLGGVAATLLPGATLCRHGRGADGRVHRRRRRHRGRADPDHPEIAENGNTVPVEFNAPGAVAVMLLASGNPEPAVATFTFGPAAGAQRGATRIRLAQTQDVIAIARMADGSIRQASNNVKVTIGGCGG